MIFCSCLELRAVQAKPTQELVNLSRKIPEVMLVSRAPGTVTKYLSTFQRWQEWASSQEIPSVPAESWHICLYVVKLLQEARTASPITSAICAMAWSHKVRGIPDPTDNAQVQNLVQAAKRLLAAPKNRKKPITKQMLNQVRQAKLLVSRRHAFFTKICVSPVGRVCVYSSLILSTFFFSVFSAPV